MLFVYYLSFENFQCLNRAYAIQWRVLGFIRCFIHAAHFKLLLFYLFFTPSKKHSTTNSICFSCMSRDQQTDQLFAHMYSTDDKRALFYFSIIYLNSFRLIINYCSELFIFLNIFLNN